MVWELCRVGGGQSGSPGRSRSAMSLASLGRINAVTHKIEGEAVSLDPRGQDESNRRRAIRAIVFSSLGLLLTSAFELFITVLSGSVALLSDALHNLGDVFTTVGVYFGFRVSRKPPLSDTRTDTAGPRTSPVSRSSPRSGGAPSSLGGSPTTSSSPGGAPRT